ncbi:MAG: hypothetical protein V1867_06750 [Candidatus Falkowbacteria bacterium]
MILTIKIEVQDKIEAYNVLSRLSFEHRVLEAELDGHKEVFDAGNKPAYFMRDNNKNIANFRNYEPG